MVSVPFKILRKETATSWVIREVTLSTAGRRGLIISKSSTTQLKAIGRHRSNTPPWQVEFAVNNGFCYNFRLGAFDILDKGHTVESSNSAKKLVTLLKSVMVCVGFVYYWSFCETGRNVVYINRDVYILEYYTYIFLYMKTCTEIVYTCVLIIYKLYTKTYTVD